MYTWNVKIFWSFCSCTRFCYLMTIVYNIILLQYWILQYPTQIQSYNPTIIQYPTIIYKHIEECKGNGYSSYYFIATNSVTK